MLEIFIGRVLKIPLIHNEKSISCSPERLHLAIIPFHTTDKSRQTEDNK